MGHKLTAGSGLRLLDRQVAALDATEKGHVGLAAYLAAETEKHPLHHLLTVATGGDLGTAVDMAAVLDWRLTALAPTYAGPLPWLPGTPPARHADRVWGPTWSVTGFLVNPRRGR